MVLVRIRSAMRRKTPTEQVEDSTLTRRQSWRRQAGGVKQTWKSLDTGPFSDGQEYDRVRLEAWLLRYQASSFAKTETWVWRKMSANGFRVVCSRATGDDNPEEICMEDILGISCSYNPCAKESEIDSPHNTAAYFRRTNLHASEDASDIVSLVAGVEAEYMAQHGQAPQAAGKSIHLLNHPLTDKDFAILTTKMGYYRYCMRHFHTPLTGVP